MLLRAFECCWRGSIALRTAKQFKKGVVGTKTFYPFAERKQFSNLPVTSYQLLVTSYQLPATSYQLPVTSILDPPM